MAFMIQLSKRIISPKTAECGGTKQTRGQASIQDVTWVINLSGGAVRPHANAK